MPSRKTGGVVGRPRIGAEPLTGAQREARRKQRAAERLLAAKAAADAAAATLGREADALEDAVGRPLEAVEVSRLRQAVRDCGDAYAAALAAGRGRGAM